MSPSQFLATVPLFRGLDPALLKRFADTLRERSYPRGTVILFANEPGDSLFIVREGRVKVVLVGDDGREVILDVLGVGDHFGELSLIDDQPRSAHVIAVENSDMLVLRRDDFRRHVEEAPAIAWAMLQALSRRLRSADEKIGALVLLDVPGRVARALLDEAPGGGGDLIPRPLTHQMIADMIGASRETVSRTMKGFEQNGWISVARRQIRIANRSALESRATKRS
jgi:CRP/FNR family cyclic AMP-dependent transcriptional regulator